MLSFSLTQGAKRVNLNLYYSEEKHTKETWGKEVTKISTLHEPTNAVGIQTRSYISEE